MSYQFDKLMAIVNDPKLVRHMERAKAKVRGEIMTDTIWDINSIQAAMRARGSHWWDPDTMRFFGCRVNGTVYQGAGGIYFVSTENQFRRELPKRYTVRKFLPEQADIETVGDMGDYATLREAKARAKRMAIGADKGVCESNTIKHKPITVLEQFMEDCYKHGGAKVLPLESDAKLLINKAWLHLHYTEKLCSDERFCKDIDADGEHPLVLRVRQQIRRLAYRCGASGVIFSGDPRGCTVKLTFPDGFVNDYGKEGYCVPISTKAGDE